METSILDKRASELLEIFEWIDDEMERYEVLIDFGAHSLKNQIQEADKHELNEVKGCQSKVWLTHTFMDGKIAFYGDSNTVITKGIVAILIFLWSDLQPKQILEASTEIIDKIGLRKHLTQQRNNGLNAMIKQMKLYALAFKTKEVNN